jgi:hypothetical protein
MLKSQKSDPLGSNFRQNEPEPILEEIIQEDNTFEEIGYE